MDDKEKKRSYLAQLPVRVLKVRLPDGNYTTALVDGDYDGEYFAQYRWRIIMGLVAVHGPQWQYDHINDEEVITRLKPTYLHQFILPPKKGYWVRHINGNRLDNRSCNLEYVTPKELLKKHRKTFTGKREQRPPVLTSRQVRDKLCKYRGVTISKGKYYFAQIAGRYVGSFNTAEEAARRYDELAKLRWGDKAILNFDNDQ